MSVASVARSPICNDSVLPSPGHLHSHLGPRLDQEIEILLSVPGLDPIPMNISNSDSIADVKFRIQSWKGFVVKNQKLVHGGRELCRNNSLVREYGVSDGNYIHLVLRLSDLRVINVRTFCGKELTLHVGRCKDVAYVKQQIAKRGKDIVGIEDQELLCKGEKLEDQRLIDDICENGEAVVHLLVRKSAKIRAKPIEKNFELSVVALRTEDVQAQCKYDSKEIVVVPREIQKRDFLLEPVVVNPKIELHSVVKDMVNSTFEGLDKGNYPVRSSEGTGGAYFMQDSLGHYVSVFKPMDEEPLAVNNPRGLPLSPDGEGLKRGTRVGEGALREVAAYILDHPRSGPRLFSSEEKGFAAVPATVMVKCLHRGFNHPGDLKVKIGSLQMFMKNYGSCEDMGPGAFPVEEVHKISVLDIRLANADRHAGNILVGKDGEDGRTVLIPIDHGYCLPESFEDCTFDWLYWPQARQPYAPETINYIMSLNAEQDIALLKFYGWDLSYECARTLRISTMLLKKGVERGLTPFAIGSIMCREIVNKKSVIEEIVEEAEDLVLPGTSEAVFLESVSQIMDCRLDVIAK